MLTPGANAPVQHEKLTVTIDYSPAMGASVDLNLSAFILNPAGKVQNDQDLCFFGQPSVRAGALEQSSAVPGKSIFTVDLGRLNNDVEKVAIAATIQQSQVAFEAIQRLDLTISGGLIALIPTQGMKETALILGEFYRHKGQWKFRCIGQGFSGGVEPLARHFGASSSLILNRPAPPPLRSPTPQQGSIPTPPSHKPTFSLNKITLDKTQSSINLKKDDGNFGEIKINLKWNQAPPKATGFLGGLFGSNKGGIDLDVGCLFELKNGRKGTVQALGEAFGSFSSPPYIQLMGDDRTGESLDGEWLRINGSHWSQIKRVLVYAFIYDGVANWQATDGVITLYVPGQPPIEVRLNEEGSDKGMCAIALLENDGGSVKVSREIRFFDGHARMDQKYGWGLRWQAGSK